MREFPNELAAEVLEAAQWDDCLLRYAWLRQYALVSRYWCHFSQGLLFRRVVLMRGAKQCAKFVAALSGEYSQDASHTQFLRDRVKFLTIGMDHQSLYANAILLCPQLFELNVRLYHASFRSDLLERLQSAPRIQALRVQSTFFRPMYQLLELFPSIRYLSINTVSTRSASPRFSPKWQLLELRLQCLPSQLPDMLSWVLPDPPSAAALEVLHVYNAGSSTLEDYLFPSLRSLHLNDTRKEDLEGLDHLEEFALKGDVPSDSALESLPTTLRHLIIPSPRNDAAVASLINDLAALRERSGLLKTVTCSSSRDPRDTQYVESLGLLRQFCCTHGITLRHFFPPYGLIQGEMEPLGNITSFPRAMPISSERRPLPPLSEAVESPRQVTKKSFLSHVKRITKITRRADVDKQSLMKS